MIDYKFYPASFPKPLQSGYSSKYRPNMLRTSMSDGYVRQRLVNQGAPDTLSIQIILNESQYKGFVSWYKGDIQCGASWFVMPLLAVDTEDSIQYRYVRIQNGEFTSSVVTTSPSDGTIYRLNITLDASNTVVDDGSWQAYYTGFEDTGHEESMEYNTLNQNNTSGTISIDSDTYNIANITLNTISTSIAINGTVGYKCIVLYLIQGTGSNGITFSNTIRWYNGHIPQLSIIQNSIDIIQLTSFDGRNWIGIQMGGF